MALSQSHNDLLMPDWSYNTLFRPVLFRLPFPLARNLCMNSMGRLASLPLGGRVIDLMGHMAPDRRLARQVAGIAIPAPVGLAAGIDSQTRGHGALSRFGFGVIEVGPVSIGGCETVESIELNARSETLTCSPDLPPISSADLAKRLAESPSSPPVLLRVVLPTSQLSDESGRQLEDAVRLLNDHVVGVTLTAASSDGQDAVCWSEWIDVLRRAGFAGPVFQLASDDVDPVQVKAAGFSGIVIDAARRDSAGRLVLGRGGRADVVERLRRLPDKGDSDMAVITTGGIHEPADALELLQAGADLVLIDSGLVFAGPGLSKRINEAVLATATTESRPEQAPRSSGTAVQSMPELRGACSGLQNQDAAPPVTQQSWFWTLLLAIGMFGGGVLAMAVATTRVMLPYDETLVGVTIDELCGANENLLPFLTHDRVTLAGTMLTDGILYLALSLWGIRAGFHWARVTLLTSALVGFFGFFLFLGFGYFDPFHAFVTAVMFQFTLLGMHASFDASPQLTVPDLHNDRAWRMNQWGQLIYILHGGAIIVAGCVISFFGVTSVFVQEDLDFMQTTAETLRSINPQLVPMIAHDRATFGAMLISCGIVVLLSSLWGFRRGAGWLWWALLLAGSAAYISTIAVHLQVGYTSLRHLLPAYGGLAALVAGSALSGPFLLQRPSSN